jgi:hypothetical protein
VHAFAERAGSGGGDLDPRRPGRPEPATSVEVVDGGERIVDGRRFTLEGSLRVGVVVAHRQVPADGAVERVGVGRCVGEPGQVLARLLEVYVRSLQGERE